MKTLAYENETEWREEGRKFIGGSDVGAILGLNPHKTAWEVWAHKHGLIPDQEENEAMARGKDMEETILRMWQRASPGEQRLHVAPYERWFDDEVPFFACTPDELTESTCVEAKSVSWRNAHLWAEGGENKDGVPAMHFCQTIFNARVCRKDWADLARLIGGEDFAIHTFQMLDYDEDVRLMREALIEWGERYLLGKEEPPVEPSPEHYEYLKGLWRPTGQTVEVTPEIEYWAGVLKGASDAKKEIEKRDLEAKEHLADLLRQGDRCKGEWGTISWVVQTKGNIDYKAACEMLLTKEQTEAFRKDPSKPFLRPTWAKE